MVSAVANISGQIQKIDKKAPNTSSADEAISQAPTNAKGEMMQDAEMTLAGLSHPEPHDVATTLPEHGSKQKRATDVPPDVPEHVRSAYTGSDCRVGKNVDRVV